MHSWSSSMARYLAPSESSRRLVLRQYGQYDLLKTTTALSSMSCLAFSAAAMVSSAVGGDEKNRRKKNIEALRANLLVVKGDCVITDKREAVIGTNVAKRAGAVDVRDGGRKEGLLW